MMGWLFFARKTSHVYSMPAIEKPLRKLPWVTQEMLAKEAPHDSEKQEVLWDGPSRKTGVSQ